MAGFLAVFLADFLADVLRADGFLTGAFFVLAETGVFEGLLLADFEVVVDDALDAVVAGALLPAAAASQKRSSGDFSSGPRM